jgi:hypothetical protein
VKQYFAVAIFVSASGLSMMSSSLFATDSDPIEQHALDEEHPTTVQQFVLHIKPSTESVGILINDVTFSIPRNYLASLYKVRPYSPVTFTAMTFYPDFAGATMEYEGLIAGKRTEQDNIWEWKFSPNLIVIHGRPDSLPAGMTRNGNIYGVETNEPDHPWKYGLLKSYKLSSNISDIYFTRPNSTSSGYMVSCINNELEICDVYIQITHNVLINYQFHRELLAHWQKIDQNVNSLIQSFIMKVER